MGHDWIEDSDFGDTDWSQIFQNPGDPVAGSDWTDVFGHAPQVGYQPDYEIPPPDGYGVFGDGLPQNDPNESAIQKLLQTLAPQPGGKMADLSSILGAFSSGEKANRVVQGNFTQNYDRLMLDAQRDRNANESDSLKKLAQTSYIMGGGSQFKPPTLSIGGKTYNTPDLGYGPTPISGAEKAGAAALQPQLQGRLSPGGSYTPQPLDDYAKPGIAEKLGSYGGAATGGIGAIQNLLSGGNGAGGQTTGSGVGSTISDLTKGLGGAASAAGLFSKLGGAASKAGSGLSSTLGTIGKVAGPIAGGAAGAYGLAKNNSVGSDIMSGAGAGASIGSLGGPIGMAIGGGVGALVGALRGAFSVTAKEQGGRDAQTQVASNLSKLSTPQQQAESRQAGWPDPNQALSLIVMRDALTKQGIPPQVAESKAEQYMHSIWDAEKGGADDVTQAARPIQTLMRG